MTDAPIKEQNYLLNAFDDTNAKVYGEDYRLGWIARRDIPRRFRTRAYEYILDFHPEDKKLVPISYRVRKHWKEK